jgi:hypothetical protein
LEENVEPKLKTDASGGNGSGRDVRVCGKTPDEDGGDGIRPKKTTQKSMRPRRIVHADRSKRLHISNKVTIRELANKMDVPIEEVARNLMVLNVYRSANQLIEVDVAQKIAQDMGYELI